MEEKRNWEIHWFGRGANWSSSLERTTSIKWHGALESWTWAWTLDLAQALLNHVFGCGGAAFGCIWVRQEHPEARQIHYPKKSEFTCLLQDWFLLPFAVLLQHWVSWGTLGPRSTLAYCPLDLTRPKSTLW